MTLIVVNSDFDDQETLERIAETVKGHLDVIICGKGFTARIEDDGSKEIKLKFISKINDVVLLEANINA